MGDSGNCKTRHFLITMQPYAQDYIYDIETYPNVFTCCFIHALTGERWIFEISSRRDDTEQFIAFIWRLRSERARMVGFNNIGFDYPVIHYIIKYYLTGLTPYQIYQKAMSIINAPWDDKFSHLIWDNDRYVDQIDLYKIHHFDNKARSTSLKILEFNMRVDNIENLPFPVGKILASDEIDTLIDYNMNGDCVNTMQFYNHSLGAISFRMDLSKKYNRNFLNHNDTKIGKDFFIMELEKHDPQACYELKPGGGRSPRQTLRPTIALKDVIFPYIYFNTPEFTRVKDWLASQVITETKGVFTELACTVNGFQYVFGSGGIHGSIPSCVVSSDDEHVLIDLDVTSFYPMLAIVNEIFPEHLSKRFCEIYNDVFNQRMRHPKKTHPNENSMFKLALNGVYGDSNNKYSVFYDAMYTMKITINGQLLLCLLAEYLAVIPGLQMIQINTDGLTIRVLRNQTQWVDDIRRAWETMTGLQLEEARYKRMFIRDVNNYIGEYEDGTLKRKGAYVHNRDDLGELPWHKNHSALIVPKAAQAALVDNADIRDFITNHYDIMDFMLRTKVTGKDQLISIANDIESPEQKVTRYYISTDGVSLFKVSPPTPGYNVGQWKRASKLTDAYYNAVVDELKSKAQDDDDLDSNGLPWDERINTKNKSKYAERRTGVNAGWLVTTCNDIKKARKSNINYEWYIAETEKLVNPLIGVS